MSLNIKNERVHALARRAAALTGRTQTGAIEEALERLLTELGEDPDDQRTAAKVDLVHDIALRYRATPTVGDVQIRRVEDLYDDATGLPR